MRENSSVASKIGLGAGATVSPASDFLNGVDQRDFAIRRFAEYCTDELFEYVNGRTGGWDVMNKFSSRNHITEEYTWNPSLWCPELIPQLTGVCVGKRLPSIAVQEIDQWFGFGGHIAITPRHTLQSRHREVWYDYTAPGYPGHDYVTGNTMFRFVAADGTPITRTGISSTALDTVNPPLVQGGYFFYNGTYFDMSVTLLDEDLPETIHKFPLLDCEKEAYWYNGGDLVGLGESQSDGEVVPAHFPSHAGERPAFPKIYTTSILYDQGYVQRHQGLNKSFEYLVYSGDSGTPNFAMRKGILYPVKLVSAAWLINPIGLVNSAIALCDANAISLGVLTQPTGYTVTRHRNPYLQ